MLFNSYYFFIFFLIIWALYAVSKYRVQNIILLAASYYFYACWDYRFLALLLATSSIDFFSALLISSAPSKIQRKIFLIISIAVSLSILSFFKYFNFFIDSFVQLAGVLGFTLAPLSLQIILPVGISFYIFKSMSYVIDIYRRQATPTRNFIDYALYVSFFPQLLAGPIERSSQLLDQIIKPRHITLKKIQDGSFYIFWGLFLKVFIADNLAYIVDPVFSSQSSQTGFSYLIAGYGYTFQIYGDFAGYSYMAMGFGGLLGFEVMKNFHLPYFAHNPQEFWRRWHISLSTWFRDYLYIPMGGSRGGVGSTMRNLLVVMLLCGLWHGAKITFVLWGGVHGILLSINHYQNYLKGAKSAGPEKAHPIYHFIKVIFFFHVIVLTWYLFRAESIGQVRDIFIGLTSNFAFDPSVHSTALKQLIFYVSPLVIIEFIQYFRNDHSPILQFPVFARGVLYAVIFYLVVIFGANDAQNFIYLQF